MNDQTRWGLKPEYIGRIINVLEACPDVERAIIFGSRAKGNFRPGSDIDLMLAGERLTFDHLLKILSAVDDLSLPWKADIKLRKLITDPEVLAHIERMGQVFYQKEQHFHDAKP